MLPNWLDASLIKVPLYKEIPERYTSAFSLVIAFVQFILVGNALLGCTTSPSELNVAKSPLPEVQSITPLAVGTDTTTVLSTTILATTPSLEPTATLIAALPPNISNEATRTPIDPISTAARIFPFDWSPDSTTLAYWTFSKEEVATDFILPPGELHFYNVQSEESCRSPVSVAYGYGVPTLTWLPNGKLQVTVGQEIMEGTSCTDDFVASENPQRYRPNTALSPDGRHEAQTTATSENHFTTSITHVTTGELLSTIQWQAPDRLGSVGVGGKWLTDEHFLIYETTEEPLLLTVGKDVTKVASELFDLPNDVICRTEPCDVTLQAMGAAAEGTDTYHIVLTGVGIESELPPLRLYHSESGAVEELDIRQQGGFSPDGRTLLLYEEAMTDEDRYTVLIAQVDPLDRQAHLLLNTATTPFPVAWSPDSTRIAIGYTDGVTIFSTQDGHSIRSWSTPGWRIEPGPWSPDGQYLALRGESSQKQEEALFIVNGEAPR